MESEGFRTRESRLWGTETVWEQVSLLLPIQPGLEKEKWTGSTDSSSLSVRPTVPTICE